MIHSHDTDTSLFGPQRQFCAATLKGILCSLHLYNWIVRMVRILTNAPKFALIFSYTPLRRSVLQKLLLNRCPMDSFVVLASPAMTSSNDSKPSEAPVDHSSAQCCHCGYRNSHAPDCPFNSKTKCTPFMPIQVNKLTLSCL